MYKISMITIAAAIVMILLSGPFSADAQPENGLKKLPLSYEFGSRSAVTFFPMSDLYKPYIADPRYPRCSITPMSMLYTTIPQTSSFWLTTSVGFSMGILRLHPRDLPERGFQLQWSAAIYGQWDWSNYRDGIGMDGVYEILATWTSGERWIFKFGDHHLSSHVTDEYIEKTGRQRIQYTRDEYVLGASYHPVRNWRTYAEVGYGHILLSANQKPLRYQAGLDYASDPIVADKITGWYLGVDIQSYEENSWILSINLQAGISLPLPGRGMTHRFGVELYRGRSPMGEFYEEDENRISAGWWIDI